jgi:hypothetical protein
MVVATERLAASGDLPPPRLRDALDLVSRPCQSLALVVGVALYFVFAFVDMFQPAAASFIVGMIGLCGVFLGEAKAALAGVWRFQFSLGSVFWFIFLIPAAWLSLGSSMSLAGNLIWLAVIAAASFVLKQMIGRPRHRSETLGKHAHPLDS